jgi:predicted nucleic acid-binding protein
MTRYLLDTDTLIDSSKGREPVRSRVLQMIESGDVLGVCAINIAEFYSGLPLDQRESWDDFFTSLTFWDITRDAAIRAGQCRFQAARSRQALTTPDALIAAVATETDATVLTSNVKDYTIAGVSVGSLRSDR